MRLPDMISAVDRLRSLVGHIALDVSHLVHLCQEKSATVAAQRQANVAAAFQGDPARLASKTVLMIDDVLTTGATLAACAQAALDAGAATVYGLTLCQAGQDRLPH